MNICCLQNFAPQHELSYLWSSGVVAVMIGHRSEVPVAFECMQTVAMWCLLVFSHKMLLSCHSGMSLLCEYALLIFQQSAPIAYFPSA